MHTRKPCPASTNCDISRHFKSSAQLLLAGCHSRKVRAEPKQHCVVPQTSSKKLQAMAIATNQQQVRLLDGAAPCGYSYPFSGITSTMANALHCTHSHVGFELGMVQSTHEEAVALTVSMKHTDRGCSNTWTCPRKYGIGAS